MTKKLLSTTLFFMIVNLAVAQRFDGGAIVGYNASQVEGDTYKGYNKPGFVAGFYVETDIAPAIFAAMEIKYSQKGARKKVTTKDPEKYIMRLNYIELPFYLAFRTNDRGSVLAGLSAGYLISGKEFDNYGEFIPEDQNEFNAFDLEPFIGFQFDFLENLKADLRLGLSVIPIRGKPVNTNYYWQNNQFNNVITLALYYQISR
ncbi:MAG: PorT family protein [Bacteroidetes bacterium]|nr:MAG: PorT family protein [Bacteroidota bacterium]